MDSNHKIGASKLHETEMTEKISPVKAFFTNTHAVINLILAVVALSSVTLTGITLLQKKAVSGYQQAEDQTNLKQGQVEIKSNIESIQNSMSIQNQQWTVFSIAYKADRKKDTVNVLKLIKGVIVLNSALEKHFKNSKLDSEYIQFLKEQLDEKKNPFYNWSPSDTSMIQQNLILGLRK